MKSTRAYRSPLRDRQAAQTGERILAALGALLSRGDGADTSIRAVAAAAGVTPITVYRHFPDKDALLRGFWRWLDVRLTDRGMPRSERALTEDVGPLFQAFDRKEPLIRAALLSPQGREMRASVDRERRAAFEEALADATAGLPAPERRRAHAVVQLLFSGYAWLSMKEQWNLSGAESGAASAWAIGVVLDRLQRDRRASARPKDPLS